MDYYESDYRRVISDTASVRLLPNSHIEIVREVVQRDPPAHILFDFDGTLSLIREGWPDVMVPMMVEILMDTGTAEGRKDLTRLVSGFVMQLNGKQTIYQMIRLTEEIKKRGGVPEDPLFYKEMYHQRLMERIQGRREALRSGNLSPDEMLIPFARLALEALQIRGTTLYLASGTDEGYVLEEARLLGLHRWFGSRIYGAVSEYRTFSKAKVIERILEQNDIQGSALLGFGDGYVEIQNVKSVGGIAVAVASDEVGRSGKADPWKRDRLIGVGADIVIPDFRDYAILFRYLWGEEEDSDAV